MHLKLLIALNMFLFRLEVLPLTDSCKCRSDQKSFIFVYNNKSETHERAV